MNKIARLGILLLFVTTVSCQKTHSDDEFITTQEKNIALKKIIRKLKKSGYAFNETFQDIKERIETNRHIIDTTVTIGSFVTVINDVLSTYNLSHLRVNTPDQMSARKKSENISLGANFSKTNDGYFVTRIVKGGVADSAGIRPGDFLIRKNEHLITSLAQLKGKLFEESRFSIKRDNQVFNRTITYFKHELFSKDTLHYISDDIAVITINTFRKKEYDRDLIASLFSKARTSKRIVLDLRSNGGGASSNVKHLLSMIIPEDTACQYFVHRSDHDAFFEKYKRFPATLKELVAYRGRVFDPLSLGWGEEIYKGEIMVMIDERSGSGGDVFPICIQDVKRGVVIGNRSLGMVLAGDRSNLNLGMSFLYPTGEFMRLGGTKLESNPCIPDVEFSREETANTSFMHDFIKTYTINKKSI
ncbi:S41 family peptidase [Aquimarina sp. 2201CG5-10]|uniref:S41 family peptidase n=1 Tax=Aquimarina callyspongiae TaxID=3098150 RepID=UPI002AB53403|nr:S41 family peptidase [Aquimarina sp. 2201CG5-10]MDY8137954.1 S41 family peptidase [Aquimarina sp. 2201CG5-10]